MHSKLNPGDLLYRSKGPVQHKGVYWGDNQVLHNQPSGGLKLTSFAEYSKSKSVKVVKVETSNIEQLTTRLEELMVDNGHYCLLSNNCEHIANYLIHGRKFSPQIQATALSAIAGLFISTQVQGKPLLKGLLWGGLAGILICNISRKYDAELSPI